jgi:hypothetical protein
LRHVDIMTSAHSANMKRTTLAVRRYRQCHTPVLSRPSRLGRKEVFQNEGGS